MKNKRYGDIYWKHDFCTNRSTMKHREWKFSNGYKNCDIEMKTGEHIVPLFSRFTCLGSTIQSGEINRGIQSR